MATRRTSDEAQSSEWEAVKRLLILMLIKMGASQGEIAMALGVDQSSVSRMFPARKVKRFENVK